MNKPKQIIIHCSATKENRNVTVEQINSMHLARGFKKIGYHYYITKDGIIHKGRSESEIGAHCLGYNDHSIGICYEGGLDKDAKPKDTRTDAQKKSIIELIKDIVSRYRIDKILGHRDTSPDLNHNGTIESNEFIKSCPCFEAVPEYKNLLK